MDDQVMTVEAREEFSKKAQNITPAETGVCETATLVKGGMAYPGQVFDENLLSGGKRQNPAAPVAPEEPVRSAQRLLM